MGSRVVPDVLEMKKKSVAIGGIRSPDGPARSLVTIPTGLLQMSRWYPKLGHDHYPIQWSHYINKKVQLDAAVCRHLFTAQSLYMFRVSQHPSTGVLKTVSATSGIGHDTGIQAAY